MAWHYSAFWEIDRDGWSGHITFRGMCDVLDEYNVTDQLERREVRQIWRTMAAEEGKVRERREKAEEERRKLEQQHGAPNGRPQSR